MLYIFRCLCDSAIVNQYDSVPTNPWTTYAPLITARYDHATAVLPNGNIFVTGGKSNETESSCEIFDVKTHQWTKAAPMATKRTRHSTTALPNATVIVMGGYGTEPLSSCEVYDSLRQQWGQCKAAMPEARFGHTATLTGSSVIITGGYKSGGATRDCKQFDLETQQWTALPPLNEARYGHAASVLKNGSIIVTGGYSDKVLSSGEMFSFTANKWTIVGDLTTARQGHSMSLLPNGTVLVSGGMNGVPLSSCEIFDIKTNLWAPTPSMAVERAHFTSAQLQNGSIIAIGGQNGKILDSCELFTPQQHLLIGGGAAQVVSGAKTPKFTANVVDIVGKVISSPVITWTVGDPKDIGTAVIDKNGVVTGHKNGPVTVIATSGNFITKIQVNVIDNSGLFSLSIRGGSQTVTSGSQSLPFGAVGADQYGNTVNPSPIIIWSLGVNGDSGTADINLTYVVLIGKKVGFVTLTASSGSVKQQIIVKIIGNAGLHQLFISGPQIVTIGSLSPPYVALGKDKYGNSVSPLPIISWSLGSVGDTGTATINSDTGILTGIRNGTITIIISHASLQYSLRVIIQDQKYDATLLIVISAVGAFIIIIVVAVITYFVLIKRCRKRSKAVNFDPESQPIIEKNGNYGSGSL